MFQSCNSLQVMRDGKIAQVGKYKNLITDAGGELVRQMVAHMKSLSQVPNAKEHDSRTNQITHTTECELKEEKWSNINDNKISQEETGKGRVRWNVYSTFVTLAYKGLLIPAILLCQVLFQGLQIGSNYWIAWATERKEEVTEGKLIVVFVLMSIGSSIFVLGRAVLLATVSIETAQRLFFGMITSIFRAPFSFFDSTPSSCILNRVRFQLLFYYKEHIFPKETWFQCMVFACPSIYLSSCICPSIYYKVHVLNKPFSITFLQSSTDQNIVDADIPYRLAGLVFALVQLLGIIVLMSQITWIIFVLFLVVLIISYWYQVRRSMI